MFDTRTIVRQSGVFSIKIPFLWAQFHAPAVRSHLCGIGTAGYPIMHFTSANDSCWILAPPILLKSRGQQVNVRAVVIETGTAV